MRKILLPFAIAILATACGPTSTESPSPVEAGTSSPVEIESTQPIENKQFIEVTRLGNPQGRTLVLIPGLSNHPDVWRETVAHLQDYDLRLVHLAGFAGLPPVKAEQGGFTDRAAKAISAHLADIPGKDTVVMGHSLGGFTTLKVGLMDEKVSALIIVDSLPYLSEMMLPNMTKEQVSAMAPMVAAQMRAMPKEAYDQQQAAGVARLSKTSEKHAEIIGWGKTSDQNTVASAMEELLLADIRDQLSNIKAKTLILAAWDPVMGMEEEQMRSLYEKQYANIDDHEIMIISDSYHFIMFDQFESFIAAVKSELE